MWVIILYWVHQVNCQDDTKALYMPEWTDLDTRPLPQWYDVGKIGIFLHWGVYSVPAFRSEWFWYFWRFGEPDVLEYLQNISYTGTYEDFASNFKAESFEPDKWAELFAKSGAQYVVLTAKHHDGFALFPSRVPNWNSVDVGPKKDIVRLLSDSVRKYNMKFGIYYSLIEWFNDMYEADKKREYSTSLYTDNIVWPDIKQLVNDYRPSVLWADGEWEATDTYWKSTNLLAWLYNESPVKNEIVVNDRWGPATGCTHGDFFNCKDRFNPKILLNHKWENAFTIDMRSWSFRENMLPSEVMRIDQILEKVISTVSCGGNALINVGPTKDGIIVPKFKQLLLELGAWLDIHGEAIYDTSPWFHQADSMNNNNVWYTCKKEIYDPLSPSSQPNRNDVILAVYAIFLFWPNSDLLLLKDLANYVKEDGKSHIVLLSIEQFIPVNYTFFEHGLQIHLPKTHSMSQDAWVLKITDFKGP
ncbi:tissue alpha-L-fucosidase-like [Hyposmocoma kahamanoa]|uniref:tissue alpha-L-fucosidase-like n=1 Tax=Hyposmocoma kahamanoa TaxID=1477025 RepID=UPI000E6DA05C|nr:tissue alpha-L-fucosidase-like [Hyposmocoma kahamanoa]